MSLYGMMRTGTSGMNAQANRLGTIADNVANVTTNGYKRASIEFSSLMLPTIPGSYNSGAVLSQVRHAVTEQGPITYTSSKTDLAINGKGFFVVSDSSGESYLTRAGSFVPNAKGELVNAAGYKLMAYPYNADEPNLVANSLMSLEVVKLAGKQLSARPSTKGTFFANLDAGRNVVTGDSAVANTADSEYTHKTSLKAYDSLGNPITYDLYFTKLSENEWEVAAFNAADRDVASGGFPYGGDGLLSTSLLEFDPMTGRLVDPSTGSLVLPEGIPARMRELTLDLSGMTQLSYDFTVSRGSVNGTAPNQIKDFGISGDGIVYAEYENGSLVPLYRVATATVASPDNLTSIGGELFQPGLGSGDIQLGFPGSGGFGEIMSGALEGSNVDLATELTNMIESQRSYTANSKVFQTGSELMDVLLNMKR